MVKKKLEIPDNDKPMDAMEILEKHSLSNIGDTPTLSKDAILAVGEENNLSSGIETEDTNRNIFQGFLTVVREFLSMFGIKQKAILNHHQIMGINELEITNKYKKHMFKCYNRIDADYAQETRESSISKDGVGRNQIIALSNQVQTIDNYAGESRLVIRPPTTSVPIIQEKQ
jgi:hypothetical protein